MNWRHLLLTLGLLIWQAEGHAAPEPEAAANHAPSPALLSLLETAHTLKSWPGLIDQSLTMYRALRPLLEAENFTSCSSASLFRDLARTEDQADASSLRETLRTFSSTVLKQSPPDLGEAEQCLQLLLRAGMENEYLALLDALESTPQRDKINWTWEEERKNFRGEAPTPQLMPWLIYPLEGAPPARAEIRFEVRREHPYDHGKVFRYLASRGRSIAGLEKERTFRFFCGKTPETLQPIGETTTTKTAGVWRAELPDGGGWLRAVVVEKDADGTAKEFPGPMVPVTRAPNLIRNAAFAGLAEHAPEGDFELPGWSGFKPGYWATRARGPQPAGAVQCELQDPRSEALLIGERISLQPGATYLQTAWLRPLTGPGEAEAGRRYLDAEGNVLKTSFFPGFSAHNWRWHGQRLVAAVGEAGADEIPPGTAFVQPLVHLRDGAEFAGLYLGLAN